MTFVKYCDREHSLFQPYGDRSSFHAPAINVATAKSTTAANSTLKTRSSLSSWVIPYLTATHRTRIGKMAHFGSRCGADLFTTGQGDTFAP